MIDFPKIESTNYSFLSGSLKSYICDPMKLEWLNNILA